MKDRIGKRMLRGLALVLLLVMCASAAGAEKKLTFTFTGDVTLGGEERLRNTAGSFFDYAAREGYAYFLQNMVPLFSSDDLTVVNLEGVLSDNRYGQDMTKTYRFRGDTEYVRILTESSVEACNIANNHTNDYGNQGYRNTLRTLAEAEIQVCGNDQYFIFEKDGIRVAFFGISSTRVKLQRAWMEKMPAKLREEEGVDAVVFFFHAGSEYSGVRKPGQEYYAELAVDNCTADLVIMHHPHVVQGIDVIGSRYVCYSLGNFCFGGNMSIRALETMAVQADLYFDDDGTFLGQQLRLYPAHIATSAQAVGDASDFLPKLVTGEEADAVIALVQADTHFDLGSCDEAGVLTLPYLPAERAEASGAEASGTEAP